MMVSAILRGECDFFNVNNVGENVFHHASRHHWDFAYRRHEGQEKLLQVMYQDSMAAANMAKGGSDAPRILEMLWLSFERFLKGFVGVETNEKARRMRYGEEQKTDSMLDEDFPENSKLLGSASTAFLGKGSYTKSGSKTIESKLGDLNTDQKAKLKIWQQNRSHQLRSKLLDGFSKDLVTPLWISALIRDEKSVKFYLERNADPTKYNRHDAQGITLYQALTDLLPEDV